MVNQMFGAFAGCIGLRRGMEQWSASRGGASSCSRRQLLFKFATLFRLVAGEGATNTTLGERENISEFNRG